MVDVQMAVINESTVKTDAQVHSALGGLQSREGVNFAPVRDSEQNERILCCYFNATNTLQIAQSGNPAMRCFERVVFPGDRLLFEALPDEQLEIHTATRGTAILTDKIKCASLGVCH